MNDSVSATTGPTPSGRSLPFVFLLAAALVGAVALVALASAPADAGPGNGRGGSDPGGTFDARLDALETQVGELQATVAGQGDVIAQQTEQIAALEAAHAEQEGQIAALELANAEQAGRIAALDSAASEQGSSIDELAADLADVELLLRNVSNDGQTFTFDGLNVQIVNGTHATAGIPNGLGNLIIGYDADDSLRPLDKTGSHNLVIGDLHSYTRYGGIVAGFRNTISAGYASVLAGEGNMASSFGAAVLGGHHNMATGETATVSGGGFNEAKGASSSVSGGVVNRAAGLSSSVSGGSSNTASGSLSSILGGHDNEVEISGQTYPPH